MLTAAARTRLAVVLVGARNPQNIGAAARAMQDFGFSDLRVVNEFAPPFEAAQLEAAQQQGVKSAVGAQSVMAAARLYTTLPEAIADCTLVAGTTAVGGRGLTQPVHRLQEAAPTLLRELTTNVDTAPLDPAESSTAEEPAEPRVALLFGSEKTGLTNEQLSYCSQLLTIPMYAPEGRHLSMNLGQAVAVCLYELSRDGFEGVRELPTSSQPGATTADRERLTALLAEAMQYSGYAQRFPANARPEVIRRLAHKLGSTREEASAWMGLFRLLKSSPTAEQPD